MNMLEHVEMVLKKTWGYRVELHSEVDGYIAIDPVDGGRIGNGILDSFLLFQDQSLKVAADAAGQFIASIIEQLCINEAGKQTIRCPACQGAGHVTETNANDVTKDGGQRYYRHECEACKGSGKQTIKVKQTVSDDEFVRTEQADGSIVTELKEDKKPFIKITPSPGPEFRR